MSLAPAAPDSPDPPVKPTGLTWRKVGRWAVRRIVTLMVCLTLYVLSIGPMYWRWYSGMYVSTEGDYWVIAFYEPLRRVCQNQWFNSIVTAYIEWWIL